MSDPKFGLTAIIPCYNEEQHIAKAIESVLFADEVLVIDSFSTDRTVEIVQRYPVTLLQHAYEGPAAQKNWAIPQAKHPWVLILDADEVVPTALQEEIARLLGQDPEKDGYWIPRLNDFMGRRIRYSGWQGDKVVRLIRRDECRYNKVEVHEEIELAPERLGQLKTPLLHDTYKGWRHYVDKVNRYAELSAKDHYSKTPKVTAYHYLLKPTSRFFKHYFFQGGYRDGFPGFVIAVLSAYAVFARYVHVWQMRQKG